MTVAVDAPEPTNRALALRIAREHLRPRAARLTLAAACAAIVAGLTGALGYILKPALDEMTAPDADTLLAMPLMIMAIALARGVFLVIQIRTVNKAGHGVVGDIQRAIFGRLIHSDLQRLQAVHSGSFVSSMLFDATVMREAATTGLITGVQQLLTVIALVAVLFTLDPLLAALTLVVGPLAGAVMKRFGHKTSRAAKGVMSETSALSTAIMESMDGVKIVKIEGREAYEQSRVDAVVQRRQRFLVKGSNARSTSGPITEVLMTFVVAGVIAYAGWRASSGGMTVGGFAAFLVALMAAGQSMRQLANVQTTIVEGLTAARRLFKVLDVEPIITDAPGATALAEGPSTIRFEDVVFAYGAEATALNGVTLEAKRGETIALVGPSGGGKSTVLNLIPRFYDVTTGRVTIDGQDVREVTLASLRRRIALVTQEPFLFDDTIRANIAYARPDASDAEIEAAARAAAAHDFVSALPGGYGAMAGEAGVRLSGGQRQRIAIARAFLKDAPILLLDEATSALDTESEALVQTALERLMSGRTTIMIAHRLSTVRKADRIYVIEAGRAVETGTHASLVRKGGLYARLAAAQNLDAEPAP